MKKLILLLLCPFLLFTGCEEEALCLTGSSITQVYTLNTNQFNKVALMGPVNLSISQGAETEVSVVAEAELFGPMDYGVRDNTLEIGYKGNVRCFNTIHGVWVNIKVPSLSLVSVSGDSEILSEGDLQLENFTLDISGEASVSLTGTVTNQTIRIQGQATVHNENLVSQQTTVDVEGSGNIYVACENNLDINVEGSAVVTYSGAPTISQDVSGSLDLVHQD